MLISYRMAGLVQAWAAVVMGMLSGSIPWFSMMILHKKSALLQKVDDTLAVFHTHGIAGMLGGLLTGLLAEPTLCHLVLPVLGSRGTAYGGGFLQIIKQLVGAVFVVVWNLVATTAILLAIAWFIPLRMPDDQLMIGDDAAHGEEAYALWGDGERFDAAMRHVTTLPAGDPIHPMREANAASGVTIQL